MKKKQKVVKKIPVKAHLEISLDEESAAFILTDETGKEYALKFRDIQGEYRNLDIAEL